MATAVKDTQWDQLLETLQGAMTVQTYDQLFHDSKCVKIQNGEVKKMVIEVKNNYAQEFITARWLAKVMHYSELVLGDGYKFEFVTRDAPMKATQDDTDPDEKDMIVELSNYDPQASGYIIVFTYTQRFWQSFLGRGPYALWDLLRGYAWTSQKTKVWPSIATLAGMLGTHRQTITGASKDSEWRDGWLDTLEKEYIVDSEMRQGRYVFTVRDKLPLLTPHQTAKLNPQLQANHMEWMKRNTINIYAWSAIKRQTFCKN